MFLALSHQLSPTRETSHRRLFTPFAAAITAFLLVLICATGEISPVRAQNNYVYRGVFGGQSVNNPTGVALDGAGNVYIADTQNCRIQKFSKGGAFLSKFGLIGSGDGQMWGPTSVAVDANGNIFVYDSGNRRLQKFDKDGKYLRQTPFPQRPPQDTSPASGVTVDKQGNVYATDTVNFCVRKYDNNFGNAVQIGGAGGVGEARFSYPHGIAVDASGVIYVADSGANAIQKVTADGAVLGRFGASGKGDGQFYGPVGVALDKSGSIYVSDTGNHRVQKFDKNGVFLSKIGGDGPGYNGDGSAPGKFYYPGDIVVDPAGGILVADQQNDRVQRFDDAGLFLGLVGIPGSAPGQFSAPVSVGLDAAGNLYVFENHNYRVQKLDGRGKFIWQTGQRQLPVGSQLGLFSYPYSIAVESDGHFTVADGDWFAQRFNADGKALGFVGGGDGTGNGQTQTVHGVAVDRQGNVFLTDTQYPGLFKFDKNGKFLWQLYGRSWQDYGSLPGQFNYPTGVAVDPDGNSYVADSSNHRVQKFDPNGAFVRLWGGEGSGAGQFGYPSAIATDSDGNVFVGDGYSRIQKFDKNGVFLTQFGSFGSGEGQINSVAGVWVDNRGYVYIADASNNRVLKFADASANPEPGLLSLNLNQVIVGSPDTTITLTGNNFLTSAKVQFNAIDLATIFVSKTQLRATIPASQLTKKGTFPVTVTNPAPGGGVSASLPFSVTSASPNLAAITSPRPMVTRSGANLIVAVTLKNTGGADAQRILLSAAKLNGVSSLAIVPADSFALAKGGEKTVNFTFPNSAAASGALPFVSFKFASANAGSGTISVRTASVP